VTAPTDLQPPMDAFRGDRVYLGADHARNERRTWIVAGISLITLVGQVGGGLIFHSMALIANGLHVGAHVAALTVAASAYAVARHYTGDPRLAFGAGKIGYLAGFANAVVLGVTALLIAAESIQRLLAPEAVAYDGALALAAAALAVNLGCVALLRPGARHAHDPDGDLNLSAAHLHLTADAAVSALAIAGLAAGRWLGWTWADPVAALIGAGLVAQFGWRLMSRAGAVLLDANSSPELAAEVRRRLQDGGVEILDLHLWRLGPGHHAVIAVITGAHLSPVNQYHARLAGLDGLSHVTIEVRGQPTP
jgi:cation diffusion facilitator family transporter